MLEVIYNEASIKSAEQVLGISWAKYRTRASW